MSIRLAMRWMAIVLLSTQGALYAGSVRLPRTGQTQCYDASGAVIACAGTGQDGESQAGAAWPSPRFVDRGDGTVDDNLTGLMWLKDGDCFGSRISWENGLAAIKALNTNPTGKPCVGYTATYADWRLPNVNELMSLANYGEAGTATWLNASGFVNVRGSSMYHSSTTQAQYKDPYKPEAYHSVTMYGPGIREFGKGSFDYTWAVRGSSAGSAAVARTGQNLCYDVKGNVIACPGSGQDGALRAGVEWPEPRFRSNGDGTVTDTMTGLTWLADAGCARSSGVASDGKQTWQEALNFIKGINQGTTSISGCASYTGTYKNWRLPNAVEMRSLYHGQEKNAAAWLNSQGFRNALGDASALDTNYYWTSTSRGSSAYVYGLDGGFLVKLSSTTFALGGSLDSFAKTNRFIAWPVRQVNGACQPASSTAICPLDGRFRVSLAARDQRTGNTGVGQSIPQNDLFGYFSIPALTGNPDNPEVFVKVLDGRPVNGFYWVFFNGLTDLEFTVTIQDSVTNVSKDFKKAAGSACGGFDTAAFGGGSEAGSERGAPSDAPDQFGLDGGYLPSAPATVKMGATAEAAPCSAASDALCLLSNQFTVKLDAQDPRTGKTGKGLSIPQNDLFGYFAIPDLTNDPNNPEVFVKVLDGRPVNGKFWVFFNGLTDFQFDVVVTDTTTNTSKTFHKDSGSTCGGFDTEAF